LESTYVWVEETLEGKSQSFIRLTTNVVIVPISNDAMQEN